MLCRKKFRIFQREIGIFYKKIEENAGRIPGDAKKEGQWAFPMNAQGKDGNETGKIFRGWNRARMRLDELQEMDFLESRLVEPGLMEPQARKSNYCHF